MCFVFIPKATTDFALCKINFHVTGMKSIYSAVRTVSFTKTLYPSSLKGSLDVRQLKKFLDYCKRNSMPLIKVGLVIKIIYLFVSLLLNFFLFVLNSLAWLKYPFRFVAQCYWQLDV